MLIGQPISVVGAGIGGLAAALVLALRGAQVEVLERAPEIAEVGAGLQISPNGFAVLRALGLGEAVAQAGLRAGAVRLLDYRRGAGVLTLNLAAHAPDAPYYFLHRADLIALLADAARTAGVEIRTGCHVVAADETADGARLTIEGGDTLETVLAIGADGVQSRLRPALNGPAEPFFTGQVAWRALVPSDGPEPPEVRVYMGPGQHLVRYPLRGGLINIVAVEERDAWAAEGWQHRDDPAAPARAFAAFAPEIGDLLERIDTVHVWGLFRHPVAQRWHGQATALLGDAAHPTLPFLAQGANLALEDAWVLAECLSVLPRAEALAAYRARRRPRAERVIAAANANARNYHLKNPLIRTLAHTALRIGGALAPAAALRRFDWLYGHDVTTPG